MAVEEHPLRAQESMEVQMHDIHPAFQARAGRANMKCVLLGSGLLVGGNEPRQEHPGGHAVEVGR